MNLIVSELTRPIEFKNYYNNDSAIYSYNVSVIQDVFSPNLFNFEFQCYFYTNYYPRRKTAQYDSDTLKVKFILDNKNIELIKTIEDAENPKNLETILFSVLQRLKNNDTEFIENIKLKSEYQVIHHSNREQVVEYFGTYV